MAKEYRTFVFDDNTKGRNDMANTIETMADDGWKLHSKEVTDQGFDFVKTCCLGCIFLPLALLGQKNRKITLIMERDYKGPKKPATNNKTVASSMNEIKKTSTNKSNKTVLIILVSIGAVVFLLFLIGVSTGISNTSQKSTVKITPSTSQKQDNTEAFMDAKRKCTVMEASDLYNFGGAKSNNVFNDAREWCEQELVSTYKNNKDEFIKVVETDWGSRKDEQVDGKDLSYYLSVLGW